MSKSWNFNKRDSSWNGRDGTRNPKKPKAGPSKTEQRRQERALKTGDISIFEDDDDWNDFDPDGR